MPTYENQVEIGSAYKSSLERVKVHVAEVAGKKVVDVRVFVGDTATRKGLCLQPKSWAEIIPIIQQAMEDGDVNCEVSGSEENE